MIGVKAAIAWIWIKRLAGRFLLQADLACLFFCTIYGRVDFFAIRAESKLRISPNGILPRYEFTASGKDLSIVVNAYEIQRRQVCGRTLKQILITDIPNTQAFLRRKNHDLLAVGCE